MLIAATGGFCLASLIWMRKVKYTLAGQAISNSYEEMEKALQKLLLDGGIMDNETR